MKTEVFVEFADQQTNHKLLLNSARKIWKGSGNKVKDLKSLELFFKPAEKKCYYVFNGSINGRFDV